MEWIRDLIDKLFFGGKRKYFREIQQHKNDILEAFEELYRKHVSELYFTKRSLKEWSSHWSTLQKITEQYIRKKKRFQSQYDDQLDLISEALLNGEYLNKRNNNYVTDEILRHRDYFDSLEKYPLTRKQCEAIVTDEYRNLVVAGAGTGKTSTLVGKAGYIIRKNLAKPEEVLLLSFGRDPRDEMLERTQKRFKLPVEVSTFHGLGMRIISDAQNIKPRVSILSSDQAALQKWIDDAVEKGKQSQEFLLNLNAFFLNLTEYKTLWDFRSQAEYYEYLRSTQPRSLKGDLVKSFEELEIANWLYVNGVEYEYERSYEHPTASRTHPQYKPDFYLTSKGIYLEHFGVDRKGNTAPFVPREKYLEEMTWKKKLHKEHRTDLIETYHYEAAEGTLLDNLEEKLKTRSVEFKPIPAEAIFERLNKLGLVQPLTGLLSSFLNLYKSSGMSLAELNNKVKETKSSPRTRAFISIFTHVFREYESTLAQSGEVDFNDLINKATEYIANGGVKAKYGYILVDEFQDISLSRYRLLKALLDANPECKLFAVGDDWQSIYRFAGSDLNVMSRFEKHFGESETMYIDDSFRFNNKICDFSTKFIVANPKQIKKSLKPREVISKPAVSLIYTSDPDHDVKAILTKLNEIGGSVLILARYNYQKPRIEAYSNLSVKFLSAHRSKGTESDYVILLGLESGVMGFPCGIVDDPLLSLVISEDDGFPNAEERRLFYVAVTRARKHVYLLADNMKPSIFVSELLRGGYEIDFSKNDNDHSGVCPRCSGALKSVEGEYGKFYSCSNYPYCTYRASRCASCGAGYLVLKGNRFICTSCGKSYSQCPSCREGNLVNRNGRYGGFWGCSNYPDCIFTRQQNTAVGDNSTR